MKKQLLFLAFAALLAGCNNRGNVGGTGNDTTPNTGYGTRSDQGASTTLTNTSTNTSPSSTNSGGTSSSSGTSSGSSSSSEKSSSGTSGNNSPSDKGQ